jgi:hypothetical protein
MIAGKPDGAKLVDLKAPFVPGRSESADLGPVAGDRAMHLMLLLKRSPEQQAALDLLKQRTAKAGDALFGKTVTPEEFDESFGIAASDMAAVSKWLESAGFVVGNASADARYVAFQGTAAQVEEVFHTEIHSYRSADGEQHFASVGDVKIPAALSALVAGVRGLQDFTRELAPVIDGPVAVEGLHGGEPAVAGESHEGLNPGWFSPMSGGSILQAMREGRSGRAVHPDAGSATTTAVTLTPATAIFASGTTSSVSTVVAWTTSSPTPTGTVTVSDAQGTFSASINVASCTAGTEKYTCTYVWNTPSAAGNAAADLVTATYSGDTNFATSSGTATLTESLCATCTGTAESILTGYGVTPGTVVQGQTTQQSTNIYLTIDDLFDPILPTGSLFIWGESPIGKIAEIANITSCSKITILVDLAYSCTVTWNPSATLPAGSYDMNADYGGDTRYAAVELRDAAPFTVTATGSAANTTTVTANPTNVSTGSPSTTFTTVTSWTTAGAAPTGTITLSTPNGIGTETLGGAVYPTAPATTSSGSGSYDFGAPYTYACTTSTSAKTVTCTITDSTLAAALPLNGANTITAKYYGDTVYKASTGTTTVYLVASTTTTLSLNPTTVNYGAGTSIAYTAVVTGVAGDGTPAGSVAITNPTLGTIATITLNATNCTASNHAYSCVKSVVLPKATAGGVYTITATYTPTGTTYATSSGTATLTVNTIAATAAASNITAGYEATITLSATDTGGTGDAAPTGGATFTVNGVTVTGTPTCNTAGVVETCTLSYALPATLKAGGYPITAAFAADSNYKASNTATATLTVNADATATGVSANPTSIAANSSTLLTATVANTTVSAVSPEGTVAFKLGATTLASCTLSGGTCSATVQGSALAAGANSITAAYPGIALEFASSTSTATTVTVTAATCTGLCFTSVTHNFGTVAVGTSTTGTANYGVGVTNKGTTAFTGLKVNLGNGSTEFTSQTNCPASLAVGKSCEILFIFSPTAAGTQSNTWSVSGSSGFTYYPSNGGTLSGTGTSAGGVTMNTASHDFGTVGIGVTSPVYGMVLTNSTTSAVSFTYGSVSAPFALYASNCGASLPAGGSCNLQFTFTPTAPGIVQQVYSVTAAGQTITSNGATVTGVTLTGTGQ